MQTKLKSIRLTETQVIAKNVSMLMKLHNINEATLARLLGVSVMTIRRVISGETEDPRISTIRVIADFFKVSVDSLLESNNSPSTFVQNNKTFYVPILDWEILEKTHIESLNYNALNKSIPVVNSEHLHLNDKTFAISSKSSMQPRFPKGTLFIINPNETVIDNDIILIKLKQSGELSLRELLIDSPKWILKPLVQGSELMFFNNDEHEIIGIVVLSMLKSRNL